ncbi:L-histidine N(alpha)-methyltransferase [Flavobacterium sp. Sd200]|uniref:L-histidine N(alpha)-methyltransferase n=1 Tax=Flavobacterium sp. Sd200 TaxID=2692211 RepID=UPI00136B8873|nr:L-histidine N(alpha)-methyltransferase [Flavobacterium sp. Sd200]MXN89599.1 L-histidine N(alpha)-methyltransferase [Flavobacterium sp. Sd200]
MLQNENILCPDAIKNENTAGQFLTDVLEGLQAPQKTLQSKYFYDAQGDVLFQQIMAMPEYYLTRCELDIFKNQTASLAAFLKQDIPFDLIELGAGDATKSSYLLQHLVANDAKVTYMPIDISGNILSVLYKRLASDIPALDIIPLEGEYFDMLQKATRISKRRKVVMFLGGNIGNMEKDEALSFCKGLREHLNPGDIVLIGFDLKKNPQTILDAYSDKQGITAAFNLNLLTRINRELGANFNVDCFEHYQNYDPLSGACRSYLISLEQQDLRICNEIISFEKDEVIYMEVSQKFSEADIESLAEKSGFALTGAVHDAKNWFTDSIWTAK